VLAVPVVVAGRSVGALSVYATEPCPWSAIDVAAVGAYAGGGADELCFLDITASHENRDTIFHIVERTGN